MQIVLSWGDMMANITYNHIHRMYAFRENNLQIYLLEGEGISATPESESSYKEPKLQLYDERGVISLSNNATIKLKIIRPDGYTNLYNCTVDNADNGIINFPIHVDMTAITGLVRGDIFVTQSSNSLAFEGINFIVDRTIDVDIDEGGE